MKEWRRGAGERQADARQAGARLARTKLTSARQTSAKLVGALLASAMLAGTGIFATGVLTGCASKNKGDKSDSGVTAGLSKEEIESLASTKAEQLGIPKDKLHEQYKFFLEYVDQVEKNPKLGNLRDFVILLFPDVAEHIKDENKAFYLEQLSRLQFEVGDIDFGGQYYSESDKVIFSSNYYKWTEHDNSFILFHETYHFVDRYIDGLEQSALYDGQNFTYIDEDFTYTGQDEPVRCYFAEEGMADLGVAKTLSNFFDSYYATCNFLTTMEYIYGEDVVEDMLYDRNTTGKFIEILRDLGYDNERIKQTITDFNAYTYDMWDMFGEPVGSFEDVLVDMYEKKIGPDWAKDPQFRYLLYNQTRAYTEARPFTGKYLHHEIDDLAKEELVKMQNRCAAINQKYDVFQQDEDPENYHTAFFQDGQLWISELVWAYDDQNEDVLKLQMLRYDFGSEKIVEQKTVDTIQLPGKMHEDYLANCETDDA